MNYIKLTLLSRCSPYCLSEELTHFGLRELTLFVLEVSAQYGPKNHTRKIGNNHKSFELYQSVIYNFLYPTVPKFPFYILCAYYPNYLLLENPNFVSLPTPNSLIFDLAYTTCINLNLWSNDKFRLKCADTSNFLWTNLNYGNTKTVPIAPTHLFSTLNSFLLSHLSYKRLWKCIQMPELKL